jgi:hypothetical protein
MIPPPTVVNNQNRHYGVVAGIAVLSFVSIALTLLRLRCRYVSRTIGYDDYAIIPALVSCTRPSPMIYAHNTSSCTQDGQPWLFM